MLPISIILPTFNGERYLNAQIESILAQTCSDFELIVIDDGSMDTTSAIIDDYVKMDRRVKRLPSADNQGHNRRLMQLLNEATGDFVAISDQDDVWSPRHNELLIEAIGNKAICFGRSQVFDRFGHDLGYSILETLHIDSKQAGLLQTLFKPLVSAHAALFRRQWIDPAAFFGPIPFDWMLSIEAILSSGLQYVEDVVVNHRVHGSNQMNASAIKTVPRFLSLTRLCECTNFIRKDRLYFFMMLDCLSRSAVINATQRRVFKEATDVCRYTWYQPLRFQLNRSYILENTLIDLLAPFSSSVFDIEYFRIKVRSLVRSQIHPYNIGQAYQRYRV